MAEDKKALGSVAEDRQSREQSGVTEADIQEFREHLGIHSSQDTEEPLFGKMEQVLNAFSDIDSQDILDALNSLSQDDDE